METWELFSVPRDGGIRLPEKIGELYVPDGALVQQQVASLLQREDDRYQVYVQRAAQEMEAQPAQATNTTSTKLAELADRVGNVWASTCLGNERLRAIELELRELSRIV